MLAMKLCMVVWIALCVSGERAEHETDANTLLKLMYRLATDQGRILESVADARTVSEHKQEEMQGQIDRILESVADARTEREHKQEEMQGQIDRILESVADARTEREHKQEEMQEQINRLLESDADRKKAENEQIHELIANQTDRLEEEMRQLIAKPAYMIQSELLCMYPPRCYRGSKGATTIATRCVNGSPTDTKEVYCDDETTGGGWLVFQKRFDGSINFNRTWKDYKNGFGDANGEFWLGLDALHQLTKRQKMELRIDLGDFDGNKAYAGYKVFQILSEADGYKVKVRGYTGDAGNSLTSYGNFDTIDRENKCKGRSGWWMYSRGCGTNLNGPYFPSHTERGIIWFAWRHLKSLKSAEMKMRPVA